MHKAVTSLQWYQIDVKEISTIEPFHVLRLLKELGLEGLLWTEFLVLEKEVYCKNLKVPLYTVANKMSLNVS